MYLDNHDYQTIWKLAHNWCKLDPEISNEKELSDEVKSTIHRILIAINWGKISVRNKTFRIFQDDSIFNFLLDFKHFGNFRKCLKKDVFEKSYLDSLYVMRPEVIAWCESDYLTVPPVWQVEGQLNIEHQLEDDNDSWYGELTDLRKQKLIFLELAKRLWKLNPNQTYEQIYNHSVIKEYGNPNVFTLDSFKKWSRPFSSDFAKEGGRPKKIK